MNRVLLSIPRPLLLTRLEAELRSELADRLEVFTSNLEVGERLSDRIDDVAPDAVVIEVEPDQFPDAVRRLHASNPELVVVGVDRLGDQSGLYLNNAGPELLMRAAASVCDSVREWSRSQD